MPAKFENSTVDTGLEKVSFHSNPKELPYDPAIPLLGIFPKKTNKQKNYFEKICVSLGSLQHNSQ